MDDLAIRDERTLTTTRDDDDMHTERVHGPKTRFEIRTCEEFELLIIADKDING